MPRKGYKSCCSALLTDIGVWYPYSILGDREVPQTQEQIRGDLIRRLFAVAISVGAASTLARMRWVNGGCPPDLREWQQLSILAAATVATVLSWDGYLVSIEDRPLKGVGQFAIDIFLVFIYMFLLMTSYHRTWWLFIHALTFGLYVIWDFLTVSEHTDYYYPRALAPPPNEQRIKDVYIRGFEDRDRPSRRHAFVMYSGISCLAGRKLSPLTRIQLL